MNAVVSYCVYSVSSRCTDRALAIAVELSETFFSEVETFPIKERYYNASKNSWIELLLRVEHAFGSFFIQPCHFFNIHSVC
jgi:hypothetical protein